MLVLRRKPGEVVLVRNQVTGEEIKITTVRVGPNSVRIGLDAPSHLQIAREELIQEELTREELAAEPGEQGVARDAA